MELKRCPFCGGREVRVGYEYNEFISVSCICDASGPRFKDRDDAINAWNTRYTDTDTEINPHMLGVGV